MKFCYIAGVLKILKMDLEKILAEHDIRPTANRLLIAKVLYNANRPLSLLEIEQEIPSLDKSSIFRVVNLFNDKHLLHEINSGGSSTKYELCHSDDSEHDDDVHIHFYCEKCNKTICLEDIDIPMVILPNNYKALYINYLVKGLCPDCNNNI